MAVTIRRSLQGQILDDTEFYEIKAAAHSDGGQNEIDRLGWNSLLPVPIDVCSECRQALSVGQGSRKSFYVADGYDRELARVRAKRSALENSLLNKRTLVEDQVKAVSGRIYPLKARSVSAPPKRKKNCGTYCDRGFAKGAGNSGFCQVPLNARCNRSN